MNGNVRVQPPVHPGEYLREEMLVPLGITPYALAGKLGVPRTRIERLVREEAGLSPDTALRLGKFFAMSPEFWLNMQSLYDLTVAETESAAAIAAIEVFKPEAA